MSSVCDQVMAALVETGRTCRDAGLDVLKGLERAYPGTPMDVLVEAWMKVDDEATEAWWQQVERTIDGEVITRAIKSAGGSR